MELTIDGETFRVEIEGADDRPTVLLSPSLGTALSLFDAQMPALLDHFRVVRYDPRGHGGSTVAGAPYSLARLGRDALAILDALGIETAHFVGISMGGAVGQWLLVNAPHRIGRAVLANTAARFGTPELWNARITTALAEGTQALAPATMERWFSAAFRDSAPERVAAVEALFRGTAGEGYAAACAALRDMDLREALFAIDRPVLILTGRDDAVTGEADIAAMTDAIRGARHVALDCRHISNIEQKAAFNAAMLDFLTAPMPARASRPRKLPTRRRPGSRATAARRPLRPAPTAAGTKVAGTKVAGTKVTKAPAARIEVVEGAASKPARKPATKKATATARKRPVASATRKSPAPKKAAAKRTPTKKTVARKAAAKRTPTKKTVPRKTVAKRSPIKKPPAKRAVVKKMPPKKAVAKTRGARRPTTRRRAAAKRPGRPGGRRTR